MGKRGPPKKPTAMKRIEGNPGKQALPANEWQATKPPECPPPPDNLHDIGRAMWEMVSPGLWEAGLLCDEDQTMLMQYCRYYEDWTAADAELCKDHPKTLLYQSRNQDGKATTGIRLSPWVGVRETAFTNMQKIAAKFGFSPSDRVGMEGGPPMKGDSLLMKMITGKEYRNKKNGGLEK